MTKESIKKRDELAENFTRELVGKIVIEQDRRDFNLIKCAFKCGLDAGYQVAMDEANQRIQKLREALEFYADKQNWYDANSKYTDKEEMPVLYMVIASIDTEGETWIGGKTARAALKEDESTQK